MSIRNPNARIRNAKGPGPPGVGTFVVQLLPEFPNVKLQALGQAVGHLVQHHLGPHALSQFGVQPDLPRRAGGRRRQNPPRKAA